ncbi:MAG: hypothetical protein LRY67_05505 [Gammaproteobacteria bacterium]|nr:hypothetical protein [Gammaproteobacteria bacterium]MCD8542131.1 hypothetical protein [Gammaproteobacteria bacterium]
MQSTKKGFALVQALFFMMFIMAVISFTMVLTSNRSTAVSGERMAADAYPPVSMVVNYALDPTSVGSCDQANYFSCYPAPYPDQLKNEGISDPNTNLTIEKNPS